MNTIYKFYADCDRMGSLEGIFISTPEQVTSIIGKEVYFGEVLGKHSDISLILEDIDFDLITQDQEFIDKCIHYFGEGTISGYNPFDYIEDDEE